MHSIFQISISRNTKCAHKVGFHKSGHIYMVGFSKSSHTPAWTKKLLYRDHMYFRYFYFIIVHSTSKGEGIL